MTYPELLHELYALADEKYRVFHSKLLKDDSVNVLGVRVPQLRQIAKRQKNYPDEILGFPNEFYEVVFLKCLVVGLQPYPIFLGYLGRVLPLVDNWAVCDCFDAPVTAETREDFLNFILANRFSEHTFTSRYCLVQLLKHYCEPSYFPVIFESAEGCDHTKYYVSMAAAWLTAEVIVRDYAAGVSFLRKKTLPENTLSRTIRKARESYRLSAVQKEELKSLLSEIRGTTWHS